MNLNLEGFHGKFFLSLTGKQDRHSSKPLHPPRQLSDSAIFPSDVSQRLMSKELFPLMIPEALFKAHLSIVRSVLKLLVICVSE